MSMLIGKVEPGDVIGRCRIIRELGRGGVGTVYLARHQTLQIEVALKVLSPALSMDNPALAERFIREAQLAARIRHPNVIAVMDAAHDEPTGLYFIVFEYVGGGALSWHLRNGPLPEGKALAVTLGIAHALVLAEESSIVHRDIKPDNIMLDPRGTAKLADLGLAKHDLDSRVSLTVGGSYMGTPAYMSPEQARDAKAADTRDDIYSLGATFYECLTGQPPFTGETPYNIMSELLTKPSPKPRDHRPELSRSADVICRKMMAKTRGLRYGDARTLVRDLQQCQTFGDGGFNQLEAASFDRDSVMARQEALQHGVHPPVDDAVSERNAPPFLRTVRRTQRVPAHSDRNAMRAAAWLLALVVAIAALLAWASRHSFIDKSSGAAVVTSGQEKTHLPAGTPPVAPPSSSPSRNTEVAENPPSDLPPKIQDSVLPPRALPVVTGPATSAADITPGLGLAVPALPLGTNLPVAQPVTTVQSAFEARDVAEMGLGPSLIGPTGKANLLKMIGRRDPASPAPATWTFYFYDVSATGNAQYITVRNGRVVKDGQAVTVALSPWHQPDIVDESKLKVDSSAALAAAQALIPNVPISSSAFELMGGKNTAPMWRISLWARNHDGQEQEIGSVQILTETGYVIKQNLTPPAS